jgi:CBS domain-containing protein
LIEFDMKDLVLSDADINICESNGKELIDLRPYMVEQPVICSKLDFLPSIVNKFRDLHLRHLIVICAHNGKVDGIITRQDIFRWMPL